MLIYTLIDHLASDTEDIEDVIIMNATDISPILENLNFEKLGIHIIQGMEIIISVDGHLDRQVISVSPDMFVSLQNYPRSFLLKYHEEYNDLIIKLQDWCNRFKVYKVRQKEADKVKREQAQRALYEELKAKYEN